MVATAVVSLALFGLLVANFDLPAIRPALVGQHQSQAQVQRQLSMLDPRTVVHKSHEFDSQEGVVVTDDSAENNHNHNNINIDMLVHREDKETEEETLLRQHLAQTYVFDKTDESMPYKLPPWAATWCMEPKLPPLPFENCNGEDILNVIPLYGGLTNALKMILLGGMLSFEQDRCFFVQEENAHLLRRNDPNEKFDSLIERYFEPMGLPKNSSIVERAFQTDHKHILDPRKDIFDDFDRRRIFGKESSLPRLGYHKMENHMLKKIFLRRLWRPLPHIRHETCSRLAEYPLEDDYIAMSVRRGDKQSIEHRTLATAQQYIDMAHRAIIDQFDGRVPNFFVATDDCSVMQEFRDLRPTWVFVSECDHQGDDEHGFALNDVSGWSKEFTDAHFKKFFVELYGLAISKVFIGWSFTNVSWWTYFMRPDRESFKLVDKPLPDELEREINSW